MAKSESSSYKELALSAQIAAVVETARECGLEIANLPAFTAAVSTAAGRAMAKAGVSRTVWRQISTVPVAARKDFPVLIQFGALEELHLAKLAARAAAASWNATDAAMS